MFLFYNVATMNFQTCISVVLILFETFPCETHGSKDSLLMSDVNLEHYYILEETVLSHADILLRDDYFGADEGEEEEDHVSHVPNLTDIQSLIQETKEIHKMAGPKLSEFLAHPINVYHMFRRLSTRWREGLDLLLTTSPCKKWNAPTISERMEHMRDSLPGTQEVERVVALTARTQRIHKLDTVDVTRGDLGNDLLALKPLDPEDQFHIIKILRDQEDTPTALAWLQYVDNWIQKLKPADQVDLSFNRTNILLMMASAHYHLKQTQEALKTTQEALKSDPSNVVARSNLHFFTEKLASLKPNDRQSDITSGFRSRLDRVCAKARLAKTTRRTCTLTWRGWTFLKTEIIQKQPLIVLFHDVLGNSTTDVLKNYALETQTDEAWVTEDQFVTPSLRVRIDEGTIRGKSQTQAAKQVNNKLQTLADVVNAKSDFWSELQVVNVGLEGVQFKNFEKQLNLNKPARGESGAFFAFLNDAKLGGEVVFRKQGTHQEPTKGSVLFYNTSKLKAHTHCPVLGSSLWVAMQSFREIPINYSIPEDQWMRRQRSKYTQQRWQR